MNKIKELFDHVEKLIKNSKYYILTSGEVISYNDEGYVWDEGNRALTPYEVMADYLNEHDEPTVEGFTNWSKEQKAYGICKNYDAGYNLEEDEEPEWDEYDPFEEMSLHLALTTEWQ